MLIKETVFKKFINILIISTLLIWPTLSLGNIKAPRIHNYADTFLSFWNRTKGMPITEQVVEFKSSVANQFPEFYNFKFERWAANGKAVDAMLSDQILAFPKIISAFEKRNKSIAADLSANIKTFRKFFPDFEEDFDIYVLHSLGEMDGGIRIIENKSYFIFGLDNIIKHHKVSNDAPFFHHELFHQHHLRRYPPVPKFWSALWVEGLATYVSSELNPQASDQDLMLDLPEGMAEKCRKDLPYLWDVLLQTLNSESETDYQNFFLLSSTHPRIPKRAGYYLGFLVAQEIGRKRTLSDLTKMQGASLYQEIIQAIKKLSKESI